MNSCKTDKTEFEVSVNNLHEFKMSADRIRNMLKRVVDDLEGKEYGSDEMITDLKHIYKNSEELNKKIDNIPDCPVEKFGISAAELAAWMSHELNNSNQAGMLVTEKMQNQNPAELSKETYLFMLSKIMRAFEKMRDIVNSISRYGRFGVKQEKIACNEAIDKAIDYIYDTFLNRYDENIILVNNISKEDNILINMNKGVLEIVIFNMVKDAYHSITQRMFEQPDNQKKGIIKLFSAHSDNQLKIIVEDNGKGITNQEINDIFNGGFTAKTGGRGIGLFLTRKIARDHGGDLTVKCRDDKWTQLTFTFQPNAAFSC